MDEVRLTRVVFTSPVLDPGGKGAEAALSFSSANYDLTLERATGLVRVVYRATRRSVEAYVPCSFEVEPTRAVPAPPPVAEPAPKRAAKVK